MAESRQRMRRPDVIAVAVLCAAQFMLIVDVVVLNVALPTLRASLALPDSQLALTTVTYTVTFGSLLIAAGRAGDLLGRRGLFLAGLGVFTVASLLTGLAQEPWQLFAGRAGQGLGAALVSPNALALLLARFESTAARNQALGVWGAVGAGGAIVGQVLGGVVLETLGWRWIFFLHLPVGVVAIALALRVLHESRSPADRLPIGGAVLLVAGLAPLVLSLAWLPENGLSGRVVVLLTAAVALLAGFVLHERRAAAPIVAGRLLRTAGVLPANLILALSAATVGASLFFTTLYLQVVLDSSALAVGVGFAPITALIMVLAPVAARLVTSRGVRLPLAGGLLAAAAGMWLLSTMSATGSYWTDVLPALLLIGAGSALSYAPTFIAATTGVEAADQGAASGLVNTAQELGPALGLAAIAGVASAVTGADESIPGLLDGYRAGLWTAAALAVVAAVVAARLPAGLGKQSPRQVPEALDVEPA
ncbi:MFS transporter [Geodermatophilus sp. URMC 64]